MNFPLRYIIVGTGGWGAHWCKVVLPRLKELGKAIPAAAVDVFPERLAAAQESLGLAAEYCYTDAFQAFEARRADFVIFAMPPSHHEKMVDMALTFDLHILCDGPIAETMNTALRIYRKVKNDRKKMAVTMTQRFDQDKQTLERLVRSNRFGRLNYVVSRFTENQRKSPAWGKWRHEMDDPLLIEGALHHFDVFRAIAGDNVRNVYAKTWTPPWGEYRGDSTALAILEMENGVQCMYEGSKSNSATLNPWNQEYFRAECEHGTLELDRRRIRLLSGGSLDWPKAEELPLADQPAWGNAWLAEQFCDWLAGGNEPPNTLSDNIRYLATIFAAIESARKDKPIGVQEFLKRHVEATRQEGSEEPD